MKTLKNINWGLYGVLLLSGLFPTLYTTLRIFFLNDLPNDQSINIAAQIQWLGLLYEVMQEGLILPMFFLLGQALHRTNNSHSFSSRVKTSLFITFIIYVIFSSVVSLFVPSLLNLMKSTNLEAINYIRLETIAFIFLILNQVIVIVLSLLNQQKSIFLLLVTQTILTSFFDVFFLSNLPFSFKFGVYGIAHSNIISFSTTTIIGLIILNKSISLINSPFDFSWTKNWFKIGIMSGLESLVRNLAYIYMIIHMMNAISQQGTYWQATGFIWGWLLLPILKLAELIKRDTGESVYLFRKNYSAYMLLTTIIVSVWVFLSPFYSWFIQNIMNIQSPQDILYLLKLLIPFYVFFAYSQIWDSYLYGIGKTDYILYRSFFMNTAYYGIFFILYTKGIFVPSLESISYMFGAGLAIISCLNYLQYKFITTKKNIEGNYHVGTQN